MNYALAKNLRDSGFPQECGAGQEVFSDKERGDGTIENGFFIRKPTLSELIESCGPTFACIRRIRLAQFGQIWQACAGDVLDYKSTVYEIQKEGATMEEAAANLWLKLNEK